jgi:hypothetical protein
MLKFIKTNKALICAVFLLACFGLAAMKPASKVKKPKFKVIAFYTGKNDQAHVSYMHEANKWFSKMAAQNNFQYDSTNNWDNMNDAYLAQYQAVLFLDTRPPKAEQRVAFQKYMENGGGWLGFHFAAFALTPSAYNLDWTWYHNTFLGSGEYGSNTWRPVKAFLRIEDPKHPATKGLNKIITASPNEWYRWKGDLVHNPDIDILAAVDSRSFPLGTGPKPNEIWHSGYYPVVWSNKNFKMVYFNMGHNDMDYEHKYGTGVKTLSSTYDNPEQEKFVMNALTWVATGKKVNRTTAKK